MKRIFLFSATAAILLTSCNLMPEADFYSDKISAKVGEDVYFTNSSENADDVDWDFGDGTYTDSWNPVHAWTATGTFTVQLTAYSDNGFSDKAYLDIEVYSPTMLEVEVLEYFDLYPVEGASVLLYPSLTDWDNQTNAVSEGFTNAHGKVIFTDLEPKAYYVDVWEKNHNNYTLRDEDPGFVNTGVLLPNELNQFTAYVDYVTKKSAATVRDRSALVVSKGRTKAATVKK